MKNLRTRNLAITAIFVAILLIQTFAPNIGYIRILPTLPAITTIPLTIAVYSSLLGYKKGTEFGLLWGITRLIVAYVQPGDLVSLLLFRNVFISLIPSIVAGLVPGVISKLKSKISSPIVYFLAGAFTSLANTFFVILLTTLFYFNNSKALLQALNFQNSNNSLFVILILALGFSGLVEMIFTAIATSVIVLPLKRVLERNF